MNYLVASIDNGLADMISLYELYDLFDKGHKITLFYTDDGKSYKGKSIIDFEQLNEFIGSES